MIVNGCCREIHRCDVAGQELRAEPFRLCPHFLHELRAHDALGKAWIVLDFRRRGELSAGLPAFNEQGREIRPRRIDRGGESCRSRTDDDDVAHERKFNTEGGGNARQRVRREAKAPE